jgi:hypothetical protein
MISYKDFLLEMKVQNADSRDYDSYELHVIPKNDKEFDKAHDILKKNNFTLNIETWDSGEDVISVTCSRTDYSTKKEFMNDVKKILKG